MVLLLGASHFFPLVVQWSKRLSRYLIGSETFVLRTGYANPLQFFGFFEMLPFSIFRKLFRQDIYLQI
jgi:hypothetical protein